LKHSRYFAELAFSYDAEINDLLTDSEGNPVFNVRLMEKREQLKSILPMIEFSPEMVLPVFYDGFSFPDPQAMVAVARCEPDDGDFPGWGDLSSVITVEPWACPLVEAVLAESAGEVFMVTAACLEFIRKSADAATSPPAVDDDSDENIDDEDQDLAESGDDWLAEQGFDSFKA
jgi:hypothetical protein